MAKNDYVHGYSPIEATRLADQANTLAQLLHHDTVYPADCRVLEAGCGIGAQTVHLAGNSPDAQIVSIDISAESLDQASESAVAAGLTNVVFEQADIFDLPFSDAMFDHVFICFVLEHLPQPEKALRCLQRVLKPGGTITVVEGDHGSTFFHPRSDAAWRTIQCLIDLQAQMKGDSLIGRRLYPLLTACGFGDVTVSPRFVYADASRPEMVEGFTNNTFIAMVEGVSARAIEKELISAEDWEKGIADLKRSAEPDGTFCYTFFKARAIWRG